MTPDYYTGRAEVIASKSLDVPFLFKPEAMANAVVLTQAPLHRGRHLHLHGAGDSGRDQPHELRHDRVYPEDQRRVGCGFQHPIRSSPLAVHRGQLGIPRRAEHRQHLPHLSSLHPEQAHAEHGRSLRLRHGLSRRHGAPERQASPAPRSRPFSSACSLTRRAMSISRPRAASPTSRPVRGTTTASRPSEKAGVIVDTAKGGAFRPNEAITRAELAAMLAQFSDAKPVKGVKFSRCVCRTLGV